MYMCSYSSLYIIYKIQKYTFNRKDMRVEVVEKNTLQIPRLE